MVMTGGTRLEIFLGVLHVDFGQGVLSGLIQLHFQLHPEFGADQGSGIVIQLGIDVAHNAQHQKLL